MTIDLSSATTRHYAAGKIPHKIDALRGAAICSVLSARRIKEKIGGVIAVP
jgi:hypothetical protein